MASCRLAKIVLRVAVVVDAGMAALENNGVPVVRVVAAVKESLTIAVVVALND